MSVLSKVVLSCGVMSFAFAASAATIYVSPEGAGAQDGSSSDNAKTLRDGIAAVQDGDIVQLVDGVYNVAVAGVGDPYNIYTATGVTVLGNAADPGKVVLDAQGTNTRMLGFKKPASVSGITFRNQKGTSDSYAAIWGQNATLTVTHCVFEGITNSANGAALTLKSSGNATVDDCRFVDCKSSGSGAVICTDSSSMKVAFKRCTFTGCTAVNGGVSYRASVCAEDCTFETCKATGGPGGAVNSDGTVACTNCVFSNCHTVGNNPKAGAIYANSTLSMKDCVIDACEAENPSGTPYGSAVYAVSSATFENLEFKNCAAAGGIVCLNTSGTFSDCRFHDCTVADSSSGCAIRLRGVSSAAVSVDNCSFVSLTALRGAAICAADTQLVRLEVRNCLFAGCVTTTGNGGMAIEAKATAFNVDNCTFANCRATGNSNDYLCPLEINGGTLTAQNCIFWDNLYTKPSPPQLRSVYVRSGSGTLSNSVYDGMRKSGIPTLTDTTVITDCPFVTDGSWDEGVTVFTPGDYTLKKQVAGAASPCVDTGAVLSWMTEEALDLAGNPRVYGNGPDLGAYEYGSHAKIHGFHIFLQ